MMGVGELPEGWVVASLDDLLTKVSNGANVVQYEDKIGYPISRIETIWNESIDLGRVRYIRESDAEFVEKYALQHGDILFSHINSDAHLGKTALFRSQVPILIHGINLLLLRPAQGISPEFLNYQFKYLRFRGAFIDAAQRAVNQSSINQKKLKSLEFVVPPTAEQHRIVAKIEELFSDLDQGVVSLKTAREQLKVYRQSLLKNAFEGKLTAAWRAAYRDQLESATALQQRIARERQARYQQQLADWQTAGQPGPKPKPPKPLPPLTAEELAELPELPEGWGWVKLGELMESTVGFAFKSAEFASAGVRLLRGDNIEPGRLRWAEARYWPLERATEFSELMLAAGEIIIAMDRPVISSGLKVARVRQIDLPCLLVQRVARIKEQPGICTNFAFTAINQSRFVNHCLGHQTGTQLPHISEVQIRSYPIPLCSLAEQEQISTELESKLSEADQLDQTLATALQQADALRQSILKKAFHGQLVKQDKNEEPATALLERIRAARAASPAKGRQAKLVSKSLTNC